MTRPLTATLCLLVSISLFLTGITVIVSGGFEDDPLLPAFSSEAQINQYLKSHLSSSSFDMSKQGSVASTSASETGASRFSNTNIQVSGVDEMDSVKTDGRYLYLVSSDEVSIVKAYPPAELGNVSRIDASTLGVEKDGLRISGIFLLPSKLIVIYTIPDYRTYDSMTYALGLGAERTMAAMVNISNPSQPWLEGACGVSGFLLAARMIKDRAYLITQEYIFWVGEGAKLPATYDGNASSNIPAGSVRYDPQCGDPSSFMNLFSLNSTTQEVKCQTIVAGYSSVVYVSPSSIYLSFQNGGYAVPVTALIASSEQPLTKIFKLNIVGLEIKCVAKGEVSGGLLNQYSMDERDGYLRLVTTSSWIQSENGVFILDKDLNIVGSVTGLAPGERTYSARFLGNMLYLVTFRQVDPLFAVDLSDVRHPQVLGELKMAGVSSYLHPYGNDCLIGIGFENSSVKISLFDISRPANPLEIHTFRLENYSYSLAQYDPHAVLFDDLTGLLVIPIWEYNALGYWSVRSSAYVFQVSQAGIALRGAVSHGPEDLTSYAYCIQRSMFMDGFLYTISDSMVKVNSLEDLGGVGELIYHQTYSYYWVEGGAVG